MSGNKQNFPPWVKKGGGNASSGGAKESTTKAKRRPQQQPLEAKKAPPTSSTTTTTSDMTTILTPLSSIVPRSVQPAPTVTRQDYNTSSISEETRISFTTQLKRLREDPTQEEVKFPSTLDNIERKFLHHLASQLGLISKSRGKEGNRCITVSKAGSKKQSSQEDEEDDINRFPLYELSKESLELLNAHISRYRLSDAEKESLVAAAGEATHRIHENRTDNGHRRLRRKSSSNLREDVIQKRLEDYHAAQEGRDRNPKYRSVLEGRKRLPAWEHREMVTRLINEEQVVIISGETGCGKSTQVPQFLLDDPDIGPDLRMAVTQPRRISAIAVAERVASERLEDIGRTVGYNIRLESEVSEMTQVVFMTPGVLLRKLANDPMLHEYTHIIIDEVHERDRNTDFLLIILRDLLLERPELRLILMSATLQTNKLSAYFVSCPVATIGSTCYPVQEFYLEDVLLQTGYISNEAGGAKSSSDPLLKALCQATPVYTCDMCKRRGFRSPEEFGTHIILCDGGDQAVDYKNLEAELLQDLQKEKDYQPDYEDWSEAPPAVSLSLHFHAGNGIDDLANGGGGGGGDGEGKGDDDETAPSFRHDPMVGGIVCPLPRATEVQAQEALRVYQFDWDDEQIDYRLIRELLVYISDSGYEQGAILVFVPGWDDISRLRDLMGRDSILGRDDKYWVLPLHSGIPSKQQREVFKKPPPGVRKIVLATNIAETSVTIDDVAFVIDSGRVKEKTYDPYLKLCTLQPTWISKASARQRRGRAGRTTAGVCFHLCSRRRYDALREFKDSELLTTPLEELCLQAKMLGLAPGGPDAPDSLAAFLSKALDPPHDLSIKNAIELLIQIGALDQEKEELTDLGYKLASMPMDPKIGKMVLWGQLLGCGKSALKIGCSMAYRDPFVLPLSNDQKNQAEKAKQELADGTSSDHLALLGALNGFENSLERGGVAGSYNFCDRYFLSRSILTTVLDVTRQMVSEMSNMGFDSPFKKGSANENDGNWAILVSVVCAGLYPGVASRNIGDVNFVTSCQKKAKLHQSSVNYHPGSRFTRARLPTPTSTQGGGKQQSSKMVAIQDMGPEFLVFLEVIRTPAFFLMNSTTPVPSIALLLLCGELQVKGLSKLLGVADEDEDELEEAGKGAAENAISPKQALLQLDDRITYRSPPELALQLKVLRLRIHQAFLSFIRRPQARLSEVYQDALRCATKLLTIENYYMPPRLKDPTRDASTTGGGGGGDRRQQHHYSNGGGGSNGGQQQAGVDRRQQHHIGGGNEQQQQGGGQQQQQQQQQHQQSASSRGGRGGRGSAGGGGGRGGGGGGGTTTRGGRAQGGGGRIGGGRIGAGRGGGGGSGGGRGGIPNHHHAPHERGSYPQAQYGGGRAGQLPRK